MSLTYTSVARIYNLEPMIGSLSDLTSAQIVSAFAAAAEADINNRLSRRYVVPITDQVPILQSIADDLSVYRILSRRVFTQDQLKNSTWPDRFKESMETLIELAEGKIPLVNSAGNFLETRTGTAQARTNTQNYLPTFHAGGSWEDQVKDADRTEDENLDRNI